MKHRVRVRQLALSLTVALCAMALSACASYAKAELASPDASYGYFGGGEGEMASDDRGGGGFAQPGGPAKKLQLVTSGENANAPTETSPEKPNANTKITRVILYSADLGLFVFDFEKTLDRAVEITKAEGGYVQASTSNSVTLRVPAARFELVLGKLDELGDANFRNVTGTDVTEEYLDLTIRLRNAEALRDRLAALLEQAKEVQDALAIEKELARVTGDIERLKGRIRYLSDRAAFSVITLHLEPKTSEQVHVDHIPLPFGWLRQYGLNEVLQ